MLRIRYGLPLLTAVLTAIIASSVLASSSTKPFYSVSDGYEISKDVEAYASDLKIDLDTAAHQLALQEPAGDLDAVLSKEEESYAGLWIQHSPQYRIVVQFSKEGLETILPYIENEILADYVEIRLVEYSLKELEAAQITTQLEIRNLDIPTNSGINIVENRVELYVVDRSRFDGAIQDTKIQLPLQTKVVTVSELSIQEADIYAGLALSACTSGFSVKNTSGIKGILTAAHCTDSISYNGTNLPWVDDAYGGSYDFQWHTAPGFTVRNLAYDGTNNRYIFSSKHRDNQVISEWVCKHGAATGYTCGYITDKNYNPGGSMNSTLIRVHKDGVNLSETGDSGGPWFYANTAYGLHVGGIGDDAYYMAINYINYLGLSVLTSSANLPMSVYLPVELKNSNQSQSMTEIEFANAYPPPNDEGASIKPTSSPESNPYP